MIGGGGGDVFQKLPVVGCPGAVKVPTDKEVEALNRLRAIKEKVRELKERLGLMEDAADGEEIKAVNALLEDLRRQWDIWQVKREEAARERMIPLGHD